MSALLDKALATMAERKLAGPGNAVLLMVSGGSDSTALAYLADEMRAGGHLGAVAMLHVNHKLRGQDAEDDARFVSELAAILHIPLFMCEIDVAREAQRTGGNVEAIARHERYLAANEALRSMCQHEAFPLADGRIFTAHTADDRVENFYMRSIVGTGPGGFRSMLYANGPVVRPVLDASREELRAYVREREASGAVVACDAQGHLWREDATNAHTDRFRAYVRHEIVPRAKERNPQLLDVLTRSMNLIADEDDMLDGMTQEVIGRCVKWEQESEEWGVDVSEGFRLLPCFGAEPLPLQRRAVFSLVGRMLGPDVRVETATVEAVLAGFEMVPNELETQEAAGDAPAASVRPKSGYVTNIQGDLAVSANKQGVLVEPMSRFRARRKKL
ncbi:MAG: tRNA lysidine(34) synthetase TilS [Eggerthellaceae bacterium]|nr:tRNA lysidine(34) synthetase TilS [Eggerthellaceae bacterium]